MSVKKLMTPRTPNYRLKNQVTVSYSAHDSKVIPAGSFVRPIEYEYVPAHCKEDKRWASSYNAKRNKFAYTRFGIILVDLSDLEEV